MASLKIAGKRERKTAIDNVLQAATVYGVLLAVFFAYFSVFRVEITTLQVIVTLAVVTLFLLLLMWNRKYRIQKIIFAIIILTVLGFIYYKPLLGGVSSYVNRFVELYNTYHRVTIAVMVAERTPFSPIITIAILGFVFGLILFLVLDTKKGMLLSLLVMLLPVIITSVVGKLPEFTKCWMLLVMNCIYLKMYHKDIGLISRKEVAVTAALLASLMIVSSVVQPMITNYKNLHLEEYKQIRRELIISQKTSLSDLKTSIKKWKSVGGDFGGGVSKGNLRNQTAFNPTGETAMEVVLNYRPTDTFYLKAYVGSRYEGETWKEISAGELSEVIPRIGGADESRAILNEPFRLIAEGENDLSPETIQIKLANASKEFGYTPYLTQITDEMNVHRDSYVKGGWSKEREYTFYTRTPLTYSDGLGVLSSSIYLDGIDNDWAYWWAAEPMELWTKYKEFVKEAYTNDYPELKRLNELCAEKGFDDSDTRSLQGKLFYWLETNYHYSRNPGEMPYDMDLIEGFLFEKKIGFCVHFASTATLIYQICGVPARYVEGYAVSPEQFVRYEDGTFRATVTDEDAHAWCEVFVEELGWQVREHTVASEEPPEQQIEDTKEDLQEDLNENETPEQDLPQENNPQQDENNVDNPEENDPQSGLPSGDDTENGVGDGEGSGEESKIWNIAVQALLGFLLIVVFMAALIFIVILQQRIRQARRLQSFRQKRDNKGVLSIYNAIYELCVFAGFKPEEESEQKKIEKIAQQFTHLTEEDWKKVYTCAERAAFSNDIISKEECKEIHSLYKSLRKDILKTLSFKKRIVFLYIKAL